MLCQKEVVSQVIKQHKSNYPRPIEFHSNDEFEIGNEDLEYPGWIWIKTVDGNEGWAPVGFIIISRETNIGVARTNYCARELNVEVGDKIHIKNTLCGWHYASNSSGDSGWVPEECVQFT